MFTAQRQRRLAAAGSLSVLSGVPLVQAERGELLFTAEPPPLPSDERGNAYAGFSPKIGGFERLRLSRAAEIQHRRGERMGGKRLDGSGARKAERLGFAG